MMSFVLKKSFFLMLFSILFLGCNAQDVSASDDEDDNYNTNITLSTSYSVNDGRLLGSQCAQCHGTNGVSVSSFDSIRGEDELSEEMLEDEHPIMKAQGLGYTPIEVSKIESWLNSF